MNKHVKTILSNTLAQLLAKFFGAGLTLMTTYYIIRLAGLELYGDLTKILVLVAVGFTAIDFGLNAEGIRSANSQSDMQKSLTHIIWARLILSLLVVLGLNAIVSMLPGGYSNEVKATFWLGSLAIIFQGFYTSGNAWFQYQLSYWRSTIAVVVGSLVGSGMTLYFLIHSPTLFNFVLANTLGYLSMALCSLCLLPHSRDLFNIRSSLFSVLPLLRRSLILGSILIASVVAAKMDTVILGIFRASSEVGEYGFAYRIFDVILVLPVFMMNAIYPLALKQNAQRSKSSIMSQATWIMTGLGILVGILLWFAAPYLYLVKSGLTTAIIVLRLLSISLPLFYITAPLMWALISKKRDKIVLSIYIAAALLNTLLNYLSIPQYGARAAAINTGITELVIFLALLYFSHYETHSKH